MIKNLFLCALSLGVLQPQIALAASTFQEMQQEMESLRAKHGQQMEKVAQAERGISELDQQIKQLMDKIEQAKAQMDQEQEKLVQIEMQLAEYQQKTGGFALALRDLFGAEKSISTEVELGCGDMTLNECQQKALEYARQSAVDQALVEWKESFAQNKELAELQGEVFKHLSVETVSNNINDVRIHPNFDVGYSVGFTLKANVDQEWLNSIAPQAKQKAEDGDKSGVVQALRNDIN